MFIKKKSIRRPPKKRSQPRGSKTTLQTKRQDDINSFLVGHKNTKLIMNVYFVRMLKDIEDIHDLTNECYKIVDGDIQTE